jgi:hypothetical protein
MNFDGFHPFTMLFFFGACCKRGCHLYTTTVPSCCIPASYCHLSATLQTMSITAINLQDNRALFWIFIPLLRFHLTLPCKTIHATPTSYNVRRRQLAQEGGKVVSPTHWPPLPPGINPGTHFCQRMSRPQGHSATRRIMSMKKSSDTIGNRTCDLPVCSTVPQPLPHHVPPQPLRYRVLLHHRVLQLSKNISQSLCWHVCHLLPVCSMYWKQFTPPCFTHMHLHRWYSSTYKF